MQTKTFYIALPTILSQTIPSVYNIYNKFKTNYITNYCQSLSLAPVNPEWFDLSGTGSPG